MNSEETRERFERIEAQTEKNVAAIRDLIVVARTHQEHFEYVSKDIDKLKESIQELRVSIQELRAAGKETDERLNILINIVERYISRGQK